MFLEDSGKRGEQYKEEAENERAQEGKEEYDWRQEEQLRRPSYSAEEQLAGGQASIHLRNQSSIASLFPEASGFPPQQHGGIGLAEEED